MIVFCSLNCVNEKETSTNYKETLINSGFIKIHLEKETTGHLIIRTKINGRNSRFILDTGASTTVLSNKLKEELKLASDLSEQVAVGAGNADIAFGTTKNINLEIENILFEDREFVVMNLDYVNNAITEYNGEKIDGIIGAEILIESKAVIDYSDLILYMKKTTE